MNKLLKAILAGLLSVSLGACSCAPQAAGDSSMQTSVQGTAVSDEEFGKFLDQYMIDLCEQDYSLAHQYFIHPEKYGIDLSKCEITLGHFITDDQEREFDASTLKQLKSWNSTALSKTNRQIYEQLVWEYELSEKMNDSKFEYLMSAFTPMNGIQTSMTTFFSEYLLYSKDDLDPLLKLINDVPRYTQEALDYSERQAELGLFCTDYDAVMSTIDDVITSADHSAITESLEEEIDSLGDLDDAGKTEWKTRIKDALDESFFPSYQQMKEGLTKLKSKNVPVQGLGAFPDGKEAYECLLASYSGTNQTPEEMRSDIQDALRDCLLRYSDLTSEDGDIDVSPTTPFKEVSEILPFLNERYPAVFPIVDEMDYEVKPLASEQSQEGVLAYFVVPPIDSTRPYEIRYNERDYGSDASSLDLYETFAHEGIPGHMYQNQYQREHFIHPIQYMLNCMGMQEGYATYASYQTLNWTGADEKAVETWLLSELYSNYTVLLMDLEINYEGVSLDEFKSKYGEMGESIYTQLALNPGVFFAYYYGSMKLLDLQTIAKETLGDQYDPVEFNKAILQPGNVEFGIIEESVNDYIQSVRKGETTSSESLPSTRVNGDSAKAPEKSSSEESEGEQSMVPFD